MCVIIKKESPNEGTETGSIVSGKATITGNA